MSKRKNRRKLGPVETKSPYDIVPSFIETQGTERQTRDNFGYATLTRKVTPRIDRPTPPIANVQTIQRKASKLTTRATNPKVVDIGQLVTRVSTMLEKMTEAVTAGKYTAGLELLDRSLLDQFLAVYADDDADLTPAMHRLARAFIAICKSYYEYDSALRVPVSNVVYDGLMSRYLSADGTIEPAGIVPRGSKTLRKAEIRYPLLHNNMDKSYAIDEYDTIPDGVKESDTVTQFLHRAYKAIGITPTTELSVEISPKIDGVSVNGTVHGDLLLDPQTRGDSDQSISVMGLNGIQIATGHGADDEFGIQYELFVTNEDAKRAAEILGNPKPYVSRRHAASGILHRLGTTENADLLQCVSLYPIAAEGLDGTYQEQVDYLNNFKIVPDDMVEREVITGDLNRLVSIIREKFRDMTKLRHQLSYAIDGIVLTIVNDEYQRMIGRTGRTNKYQIALKFDPSTAIGVVDHIELDCGKKGYRTPQVYLANPVYLDGVEYDHVPVLSANLFDQLGLRVGTTVNIHRVGDVIPSITVIREGTGAKLKLPDRCPICDHPLMTMNKKLYCNNPDCVGNLAGKFTQFFTKLGMDGYSDAFARMLADDIGCKSIADVVSMTSDTLRKHGVDTKLAKEFSNALTTALTDTDDYVILGAIGLPGVGIARAKIILAKCPFDELQDANHEKLRELAAAAVGDNYTHLYDAMCDSTFAKTIAALATFPIRINTDFESKFRVGHTGTSLSSETTALCRRLGFEIVDGKTFDLLITADLGSSSGKMETAKKRNLPIMLERDFIRQYTDVDTLTPEVATKVGDLLGTLLQSCLTRQVRV